MELREEPEQMETEEVVHGQSQESRPQKQERPAPDLSPYSSLISALSSASKGHKIINLILARPKEFAKLLSLVRKSDPLLQEILEKVRKALAKGSSSKEKFLGKLDLPQISCDSDLFKAFLKEGMKAGKNWENGAVLVEILAGIFDIFGRSGGVKDPILGVKMILSHSLAEDIFLEWQDRKKTIMEYGNVKAQLLKLWKVLVAAFTKISKEEGTEGDKKILENSVTYLMQMYGATLSPADIQIFTILKLYSGSKLRIAVESMPMFGLKSLQQEQDGKYGAKSNPLFAHSVRANQVLSCVQDGRAFDTGMKWDEALVSEDGGPLEELYDLRFLLPLLCHVLDEKNVCDVIKVLNHGWIYFIARGMSLEDKGLRNCAFLAYKRLVYGLHLAKGFRVQDVKVWLHFLLAVKQGLVPLGEMRLPCILSTWIVATCQVLKLANHPLYSKVTHFLLAKPIIDLTIVPDFINFFNAEDGNRDTRDWVLNILLVGLRNAEDWTIIRKVPTIKLMCSLFPLEKIGPQRTILKILAEGAKIPDVAQDLVDRHGLLLWIANMKFDDRTYYKREVEDIYRNLSKNCPQGRDREFLFQFVGRKHNWPCSRNFENADKDAELDDTNEIENSEVPISEVMDVL